MSRLMRRGGRSNSHVVIAVLAVIVGSAAGAPLASAQIIGPQNPNEPKVDSPWQAGTCKTDAPEQCSIDTPAQFFEEAAGHPKVGFTQFIINSEPGPLPLTEIPTGDLKTVRVDLPAGLAVNPQATPQCDLTAADPETEPEKSPTSVTCPPDAQVGTSEVTAVHTDTGAPVTLPPVPVYNVNPKFGEPARFGLSIAGSDVFLEADIAWESDYHEYFTIHVHKIALPALGEKARVAKNRLVFDGTSGDGTYITTPTTCLGPAIPETPFEHVYSTFLRADSFQEENPSFPNGSAFVESKIPRDPPLETSPKNCDDIPFEPSIDTEPNTEKTDSPSGATVTVSLPEIKNPLKLESSKSTSQVRSAQATLPVGMGLNPSAANGLEACTDAQFGKGTRAPVNCPAASRIGTVEVDTPPLPEGSLTGPVFVGQQLSRDPASGETYRIFVDVESPLYDISARLLGKVSANPQTGQLKTTFDDAPQGSVPIPGLPQVPFRSFKINFDGGAKAPLTSPPTCGPNTTTSQMTPWSSALGVVPVGEPGGPSGDPPATPTGDFELANLPSGGACPKTLAERPFGPGFGTKASNSQAGAFTEFEVDITRQDGEQELKGTAVKLPPGFTAKLAGVKYCPESAIAASAANSGLAEAATSTCPSSSLIGSAAVLAGTGPSPLSIAGKVFLTGPYRGAPLSIAVVTPATAGPFDLGSVVVRVALFVHPETARVEAVSDPIPHVFGGALLDIRSIAVRLDRPRFSLNPTNCSAFATEGVLRGGGADPLNPAAFSSFPVSAPFQVKDCNALGFKPRLFIRLFGAARRGGNPKLRAVFKPRLGDANPARVAVTLPRALFLDQANLVNVCTRVQFAAKACPRDSIYGHAKAFSPLLDEPLKGLVYLRSSDNELPDLVTALRGQVDIDLVSRTDSVKGRIRNTFDVIPDVPVSKFLLTVRGGKRGLLENSRNLCPHRGKGASQSRASRKGGAKAKPPKAIVRMKGQNGKKANRRIKVRRPCGKGNRKKTQRRN